MKVSSISGGTIFAMYVKKLCDQNWFDKAWKAMCTGANIQYHVILLGILPSKLCRFRGGSISMIQSKWCKRHIPIQVIVVTLTGSNTNLDSYTVLKVSLLSITTKFYFFVEQIQL